MRQGTSPKHYLLAQRLKNEIESGVLVSGQKLLPEDHAAAKYGISRQTLRQAYCKLAREGYLLRLKAKGTFVANNFRRHRVIAAVFNNSLFVGNRPTQSVNDIVGGAITTACPAGCELRALAGREFDTLLEELQSGDRSVCGVLFIRYRDNMASHLEVLKRLGIPFVLEGCSDRRYNCVDMDHRGAMLHAVKYLYASGHRKIGILGDDGTGYQSGKHFLLRTEAAQKAIERYTGSFCSEWLWRFPLFDPVALPEKIEQFMKQTKALPTAWVGISDLASAYFIRTVETLGYRVPEDFSVTGFGNIPEGRFLRQGLTTYNQDYQLSGQEAVKSLLELLDAKRSHSKQVILPAEFIERGSCRMLPAFDRRIAPAMKSSTRKSILPITMES